MTRKCIISAVVMFVMAWALSFVVHGLILGPDYAATPACARRPRRRRSSTGSSWRRRSSAPPSHGSTTRARKDKPWLAQGIRFGIAVACLTVIPTTLIYHVVTPVAFGVAIKQIVLDTIRVVLMGIVLAWINR